MSVDVVEIDCPNCGKMIHSSDDKCPFCCSHLEFYDFDDLELVANGKHLTEKECRPKEEPAHHDQGSKGVDASVPMDAGHGEKKGLFGKLFGRGKK
jgi:endogenous inhibitor of DNA gyrase (YacG/DUF329 family)